MIDNELKQLADRFGKQLAESAIKHMAASSGAKVYTETKGRTGDANRVSPTDARTPMKGMTGKGDFGYLKDFDRSVENTNVAMKGFTGRLLHSLGKLKDFKNMGQLIRESKLEQVVGETRAMASSQTGAYREMLDAMLNYVEENETNFKTLKSTANNLQSVNMSIHKVSQDFADGNLGESMDDVIKNLTNFDTGLGKKVDLLEDIPLEELVDEFNKLAKGRSIQEIQGMAVDTDEQKAEQKELIRSYNDVQEALRQTSGKISDAGRMVTDAGISITENTTSMLRQQRQKMATYMKVAAAGVGAGVFQYMNDTLFQYQSSIGRQYKVAAADMGMSHHDMQLAMLDYRDTLRFEAAQMGTTLYSDEMEESMKRIGELGGRFGLTGTEAFRFGLQLKDTARMAGMANASEEELIKFVGESAKVLNMSVPQFADFFNNMAKDPAFTGFVNSMRGLGPNLQESAQNELSRRIKMNKILGLSNENMQQRLNMENAKKWAPIVEKYKSAIGVSQMISTFEKEFGISLSEAQKEAIKMSKFDPSLMTEEQRKIVSDLRPLMEGGAEMYNQKMREQYANASDAEKKSLKDQIAIKKEVFKMWNDMAGYSLDEADAAYASLSNMAEQLNEKNEEKVTPEDIALAIAKGTEGDIAGLAELREKMTAAEAVEATVALDTEGLDNLGPMRAEAAAFYRDATNFFTGMLASAPAKAVGGIAAGAASIAWEFYQYKSLKNAIGVMSKSAGAVAGAGNVIAAGGVAAQTGIAGFNQSVFGASKGIGKFARGLGALGGMLLAYDLGTRIGTWIYENVKDSPTFLENVDIVAGAPGKLKDWLFGDDRPADVEGESAEFNALSEEQRAEAIKRRAKMNIQIGPDGQAVLKPQAQIAEQRMANMETASKELQKSIKEMEDERTVVESELSSKGYSQLELQQKTLDELQKLNNTTEKQLNNDKVATEEQKTTSSQLKEAIEKAKGASVGWQDSLREQQKSAAAQYS